ncbi:MAG TPA: peptidoglycan editing factor PgeF [Terriglobales bacterium]|nr:peptidoglycan editing factor PgeF [Terriglobales bacterium]
MATLAKSDARKRTLDIIQAPALKKVSWLVHGFSTRANGSLGFVAHDTRERVQENRRRFLAALGAPANLVTLRQIHSDIIHVITSPPAEPLAGDGLITNVLGITLGILTADCFPVLLADSKNKAVGAFHAGWRGTVARIAEKGLGLMRREYGTKPEDVVAAIGPGIQQCCYEVGEEVKSKFESQFAYAADLFREIKDSDPVREKYPLLFMNMRAPGHGDLCVKLHLDLREANRRQLLSLGVKPNRIFTSSECTACNVERFFSHRAEKGKTGRTMAVIGMMGSDESRVIG